MVFFKPLLLVLGAYALYSYFRGDDRPPPPPPPPPRTPPPRREGLGSSARPPPRPSPLYSSPAPAPQTTNRTCQCDSCQRRQRRAAENVSEHQRLSSQNLARHSSQIQSPPQSQVHQHPIIEPLRNAEASNEDDERDPHYLHLRREARKYGELMTKSSDESRRAYSQGERARAKELSNQRQKYQKLMEHFDSQASEWIFEQNNKDIRPYTVDLHGLYVKEATNKAERSLKEAQARSDPFINFIVGKGLHSKDGNAKLRPAIIQFIRKAGLSPRIDPSNMGVLIVELDSAHLVSSGGEYFRDRTNLVL